jgi:hypothetical protein
MRRLTGPIAALVCLGLTWWFAHDGFFNPKYQQPGEELTLWFNRVCMFICPVLAILAILHTIRVARQSYVLDEEGISVHGAEPIPLASITEIDDSTYDEDRYLRIHYKPKDGDEQILTIDAQRFEGTDELLDELFDATKLPSKVAAPPEEPAPGAPEAEPAEDAASEQEPPPEKDAEKSDA